MLIFPFLIYNTAPLPESNYEIYRGRCNNKGGSLSVQQSADNLTLPNPSPYCFIPLTKIKGKWKLYLSRFKGKKLTFHPLINPELFSSTIYCIIIFMKWDENRTFPNFNVSEVGKLIYRRCFTLDDTDG